MIGRPQKDFRVGRRTFSREEAHHKLLARPKIVRFAIIHPSRDGPVFKERRSSAANLVRRRSSCAIRFHIVQEHAGLAATHISQRNYHPELWPLCRPAVQRVIEPMTSYLRRIGSPVPDV
jgi:hypothetical protein